eukprot:COSAG02_NODE_182_length_30594_cov_23.562912_21_plen_202_part_00
MQGEAHLKCRRSKSLRGAGTEGTTDQARDEDESAGTEARRREGGGGRRARNRAHSPGRRLRRQYHRHSSRHRACATGVAEVEIAAALGGTDGGVTHQWWGAGLPLQSSMRRASLLMPSYSRRQRQPAAALRHRRRCRPRVSLALGWLGSTHEEVNHLMDSEGAGAVVVQQSVERLKLRSASAGRGTAGQGGGGGSAGMGGQ